VIPLYQKIVFLRLVMKKITLYVFIVLLLPSCRIISGSGVAVVKPKYHHHWYDRKKDKKVKRTRIVRMKN